MTGARSSNPKLPPEAPRMTPTEADRLIEWHQMAAQVSEQTDDFAGARWHREKLAAWRAWRGVARASDETPVLTICDCRAGWKGCEKQPGRTCAVDHYHRFVEPGAALKASDDIRRPTGQCNWGCYYSANGRLIRDADCTVHGASSENGNPQP